MEAVPELPDAVVAVVALRGRGGLVSLETVISTAKSLAQATDFTRKYVSHCLWLVHSLWRSLISRIVGRWRAV